MAEPIPDVLVELLALGELDEAEAAEIRAQLEAEGDERLAEIERSNTAVLERYPPDEIVPKLQASARVVPLHRPAPGWIVGALAAAAALVLVWMLSSREEPERERERIAIAHTTTPGDDGKGQDTVRRKGEARLLVYRQGAEEPLEPEALVRAGDLLQVTYVTGPHPHGVIVSLDGAGVATLHWPSEPGDPTTLAPGVVRLDHAYELDDAPGFERFFFVTADEPLDPERVLEAARELGHGDAPTEAELALPDAWWQRSLVLRKPD